MKKILFLSCLMACQIAYSQSALITPNGGGNGNFLFKSTGANYGQFSTTAATASLAFRINEPALGNGSTGSITGAIYSDNTRLLLAGYLDKAQFYGINRVEIGTNAVNDRMVMTNIGHVGIGVTEPVHKFEVFQTGNVVSSWGGYNISPLKIAIAGNGSHATLNESYDAVGVAGYGNNAANTNYRNIGVLGSTGNTGLYNVGVYGHQSGNFEGVCYAVEGISENNAGTYSTYGVYGVASGTGAGKKVGVYGQASGSGDIYGGLFYGRVHVNGNITYTGSVYSTSDEKLKTKLKVLDNALDKVLALNPSTYEYRTDEYKNMNLTKGLHYGFTAQGVQKILPQLVSEQTIGTDNLDTKSVETTKYLSVNYIEIIPILTKAIQEQQEMIMVLQADIAKLKK